MSNRKWILAIGLLVTAILIGCQTGGQTGTEENVPVLSTPEVVEVTSAPVVIEVTRIVQGIDTGVAQEIHPFNKVDVRTFDSSIIGRVYTIYVGLPRDYSAEKSYPVVYVLDGDYMTMLVWSLTDVLVFFDKIPPVIVVGIGYSGDNLDSIMELRSDDLLVRVDDFLQFIQVELIPEIEANYSTDPSDRTIFGHSYAGEACLYAMFHKPGLFQRYIVGSPTGPLQMYENEYAESHDDLPVSLYLFIGSLERHVVVSNLYDRLATRQYSGLKMEMDILEGDTHFTVVPGATFKGLISVFGK